MNKPILYAALVAAIIILPHLLSAYLNWGYPSWIWDWDREERLGYLLVVFFLTTPLAVAIYFRDKP